MEYWELTPRTSEFRLGHSICSSIKPISPALIIPLSFVLLIHLEASFFHSLSRFAFCRVMYNKTCHVYSIFLPQVRQTITIGITCDISSCCQNTLNKSVLLLTSCHQLIPLSFGLLCLQGMELFGCI